MDDNQRLVTRSPMDIYSANTRVSQTIMSQMINLMNIQDARLFTLLTQQNNNVTTTTTATNTTNPVEQYIRELFINSGIELDFRVNDGEATTPRLTPRLTQQQITSATSQVTYASIVENDENVYDTCPISQEPFTPDTNVTRINHCGHHFSTFAINRWFEMNSRCPVCRYDIQDDSQPNTPTLDNDNDHSSSDPDTP